MISIYLLTAIGQPPGGSRTVQYSTVLYSTVQYSTHLHTNSTQNNTKQIIHKTTQKYIEQHKNQEECGPCPVLACFTLAFALQLRKKHGKTSVRVVIHKPRNLVSKMPAFEEKQESYRDMRSHPLKTLGCAACGRPATQFAVPTTRHTCVDATAQCLCRAQSSHFLAIRISYRPSRIFRFNPLNPELNPICYLLALLAHHFLHISRIMVKSLTLRFLISYIYKQRIFLMFLDHTQRRTTVGMTPLDE